jgi:hypothetical protein
MSNPENTVDVAALTDADLDAACGGIIGHLTAAVIAGVIGGWDIAPGVTLKDAAKALGMEHIL